MTYRKVKGGCSSHQIRNVAVEELLLDGIRRVTAYARNHENKFVQIVTKETRIDLDRSMPEGNRELEQSQARIIGEFDPPVSTSTPEKGKSV